MPFGKMVQRQQVKDEEEKITIVTKTKATPTITSLTHMNFHLYVGLVYNPWKIVDYFRCSDGSM